MLRPLPQCEVQHFNDDRSQDEAHQKTLHLIDCPRSEALRREFEAALQAESVVVETDSEDLLMSSNSNRYIKTDNE